MIQYLFFFKGNKSAEAEEEEGGADVHVSTASSLVGAARLEEIPIINTKKDFKTEIKKYSKKLIDHVGKKNPDRMGTVKAGLGALVKKVLEEYEAYSFLAVEGDAYELDGPILLHTTTNENKKKGDQIGDVCKMIVFKDNVYEQKCVSLISFCYLSKNLALLYIF